MLTFANVPGPQGLHVELPQPEVYPRLHFVQDGAPEPENVPAGHLSHAKELFEDNPAAQGLQMVVAFKGAMEPGLHGVHLASPLAEKVPLGQASHEVWLWFGA